jgi:quercetin dioxygenase-like cupin family protein
MNDSLIDEQRIIDDLKAEGYDNVWAYEAEPEEIDEEHSHEYDTKLVILSGDIQITSEVGGAITNMKYVTGQTVEIPRNKLHSAKVGPDGCRYIVAENH